MVHGTAVYCLVIGVHVCINYVECTVLHMYHTCTEGTVNSSTGYMYMYM